MTSERPPWDPDPRYVAPPEPVRITQPVTRRSADDVGDGGVTLGVVALALAAVIAGMLVGAWLARSVDTTSRSGPVVSPRPAQSAAPSASRATRAGGAVLPATDTAVSGLASWYCGSRCTVGYPGGMYAAAGSELRHPGWRGSRVQVCSGGRCVVVTLVDWCACAGARIIDLYSDAFRQLAPLSRGVIPVTVTPGGRVGEQPLPATDTKP